MQEEISALKQNQTWDFGAQARWCEIHFLQMGLQSEDSTGWFDWKVQGATSGV